MSDDTTLAEDLEAAEAALAEFRRVQLAPLFPEMSETLTADFDAGFTLRPGDTLLVSTVGQVSLDQAQTIRERLLERLPKLADVIVMPGLTVQAVYRDDKDET